MNLVWQLITLDVNVILQVLLSLGNSDPTSDELPAKQEGAEEIIAKVSGPEDDVVMDTSESAPTETADHVMDETSAQPESEYNYFILIFINVNPLKPSVMIVQCCFKFIIKTYLTFCVETDKWFGGTVVGLCVYEICVSFIEIQSFAAFLWDRYPLLTDPQMTGPRLDNLKSRLKERYYIK